MFERAVEIAKKDHPNIEASECEREIDRLAESYRKLLPPEATPAQKADAFRKLFFEQEKYETTTTLESAQTLHLDSVLASKKGYCLSLSLLALLVAERTSEPLFGVAYPNHFFLRYQSGEFRRNLEFTQKGKEIADEDLRKKLEIPLPEKSVYMRNLSPAEVGALLLHNRGFVALHEKRWKDAEKDFRACLAIVPDFPEAHRNLGVLYGENKDWLRAKESLETALRLFPRDADALINLAICKRGLGDLESALKDLEIALLIDPSRVSAHKLAAQWKAEGLPPLPLEPTPAGMKPGLRASYFRGIHFDKQILERIDPDLDFDWQNNSPAPGVPADRFSVRWEGFFRAPAKAKYSFFLIANDGARLDLGGQHIFENWREMGYENWYGSEERLLDAGWHPIRIEHFDERGGARLILKIGQESVEKPLPLKELLFHRETK